MATVPGTSGPDNLQGTGTGDRITGGSGNDTISGRNGTDTAVYSGTRDDYRVDVGTGGFLTITDLRSGSPNGADTVAADVEFFEFTGSGPSPVTLSAANVRNDRPRAADDAVVVLEDGGVVPVSALLGNDTEFDLGDALTLVSVTNNGTGGSVALVNGELSYTPTSGLELGAGQTATDSFTYTIRDAAGLTSTATATVTIQGVNDAPNGALANVVATTEDTASAPVAIGAGDLDGDALSFEVQSGAGPEKGTVSFDRDAGTFVYTPDENAHGTDTFTIVVSDGQGGSFEQVVSATIGSVNDGPTVLADAISVDEDGSFSGNVFSNDSDLDPGAVLSVSGLAAGEFRTLQGQFGTLKLFGDGSYTYAADRSNDLILGESGTDGFTYELSDGDGGTATGSFSAEVSGRDEDMVGNAGADVMTGERGADSLKGLDGPDLLRGHAGEDRLEGGGGDDTLDGGADGDRLEGGDGNDFCRRITSGNVIVETSGGGSNTVATSGDFTLADGLSIEQIVGMGSANLTLVGNASANVIRGARGTDSLSGGGGDDTMNGGAGANTLDGGLGRDLLGAAPARTRSSSPMRSEQRSFPRRIVSSTSAPRRAT